MEVRVAKPACARRAPTCRSPDTTTRPAAREDEIDGASRSPPRGALGQRGHRLRPPAATRGALPRATPGALARPPACPLPTAGASGLVPLRGPPFQPPRSRQYSSTSPSHCPRARRSASANSPNSPPPPFAFELCHAATRRTSNTPFATVAARPTSLSAGRSARSSPRSATSSQPTPRSARSSPQHGHLAPSTASWYTSAMPQFGGPEIRCRRDPPGHDRHMYARVAHHSDSQAVLDVEPLEFDFESSPLTTDVHPAVGEDTVHVQYDQANAPGGCFRNLNRGLRVITPPLGPARTRTANDLAQERDQLVEREHAGRVGGCRGRVRVHLEKESIAPRGDGASGPARRCVRALLRWTRPRVPPAAARSACRQRPQGAPVVCRIREKLRMSTTRSPVAERRTPLGHEDLTGHHPRAPSPPRRPSPRGTSTVPFLMFTAFPVSPAATSSAVWRQRKAGIWSMSATSAAGTAWAGSWMSVRIGTPVSSRTLAS